MKRYAIGIDLGGSKIYTILANRKGKVLAELKLATEAKKGKAKVLKNIFFSIAEVLQKAKIKKDELLGIGLGLPGPVDFNQALAQTMPNLHGLEKVNLKTILEKKLRLPVLLENDANLAALAEGRFGIGNKAKDFIYITVSTGIGAGIVINRKLYRGIKGAAGEVGHMIIKKGGPVCGCGQRGCLEALASGSAINRLYGISAKELEEKVSQGEKKAKAILKTVIDDLAIGLANLVNIFNPELIIIGGGLSKLGSLLFRPLRQKVKKYSLALNSRQLKIVPAKLGERVGAIGAVSLVFFGQMKP